MVSMRKAIQQATSIDGLMAINRRDDDVVEGARHASSTGARPDGSARIDFEE